MKEIYRLIDRYFDMFEAQYYHPAYVDRAKRQFKQYVFNSGELNSIVLGYIERQKKILNHAQ